MTISIIAAVAKNNVIGGGNSLLWHLPADMKHFKELTSGHTVIMGRKTFESINKPLPNRRNIVVTRESYYKHDGLEIAHSLDEALNLCVNEDEVFIIGGGEIYKQAFEKADKLYITHVEKKFDGDTFFPEIKNDNWEEISRESHELDEINTIPYIFSIYKK